MVSIALVTPFYPHRQWLNDRFMRSLDYTALHESVSARFNGIPLQESELPVRNIIQFSPRPPPPPLPPPVGVAGLQASVP